MLLTIFGLQSLFLWHIISNSKPLTIDIFFTCYNAVPFESRDATVTAILLKQHSAPHDRSFTLDALPDKEEQCVTA